MKYLVSVLFLIAASPVFAQQADPQQLQRVIDVLVNQRNTALNSGAVAEANLAETKEALKKAEDKIKELTDKKPAK